MCNSIGQRNLARPLFFVGLALMGAALTYSVLPTLKPASHLPAVARGSANEDPRHPLAVPAPDLRASRVRVLSTPTILPAAWHVSQAAETPSPTPTAKQTDKIDKLARIDKVKIDVDVTRTQPADLDALRATLADATPLPGEMPVTPSRSVDGSGTGVSAPLWFVWANMKSARTGVRINVPASLPIGALGVYATHSEYGVGLCLVNKSKARLLTSTAIRLPRGAYRIERLTFSQPAASRTSSFTASATTASDISASLPVSASLSAPLPLGVEHLERLEGCDFGAARTVHKELCLEPGEVCFYRYTDVARLARATWSDVFTQLQHMARAHPGPAHRLATMLHEADGYIFNVQGSSRDENIGGRLESIHHLLLVAAQAYSLHHNYQMRHTVDLAEGKAVMGTLNRLIDALSETSATILGLVPQVAVTSSPDAASKSGVTLPADRTSEQSAVSAQNSSLKEKEEKTRTTANHKSETVRTVIIALANTGDHSISNVKLGLNTANLPASVAYDPADPAYFGALHPGQTVRATFHLHGTGLQEMPDLQVIGDVSYFAGTAAAHLCPHAW